MKKVYITAISFILIMVGFVLSNTSYGLKLVDDEYFKAGIYEELLENKKIIAISPNELFKATKVDEGDTYIILKKDLENIFSKSGVEIVNVKNKNGKLYNETSAIGTGAIATSSEGEQYTVLLYGDANGDGRICNSMDIEVIRQDYVFDNKAEGVYKLAADLRADGKLNVKDVRRMIEKYLGELDTTLVEPFPEDEVIFVVKPEIDATVKTDGNTVTVTTTIINAEEFAEYSTIKNYIYTLKKSNGISFETVTNGTIETSNAEYIFEQLDDGEYTLTVMATAETGDTSNTVEKTFEIETGKADLEIIDFTKETIIVKASIEEKEIISAKHFYKHPSGYVQNPEWKEVEGVTTPEYTYTNELLEDNKAYEFKAEVTTSDGKIYETNTVTWLMGNVGIKPVLNVTTETDDSDVTINVEVTNLENVNKFSEITDYGYVISKQNGNSYTELDSITTDKPNYTFSELEDGEYQILVFASTEKGAMSEATTSTFTIKKTVATLEIVDYTKNHVEVESLLDGKDVKQVEYLYREKSSTQNKRAAVLHKTNYAYGKSLLTEGTTYILKAIIEATDGKKYETNEIEWAMGYAGVKPVLTVTTETDDSDVTVNVEVTNLEDVNQFSEIAEYSYIIKSKNGNDYVDVEGYTKKTNIAEYNFTGLEDGSYCVFVTATTEKGEVSDTVMEDFTIKKAVATIEIKDYTQGSITVEASITGKESTSVKHLYRTMPGFSQSNVNEWLEVENVTAPEYAYGLDLLTKDWPYQFMAKVTTTDGKIYETNIVEWKMGYIGANPDITVTATPNEDSVTINTVVTNDVIVDNYKYSIQKKNANGSYLNTEHIVEGLTTPKYTFEGLEDGEYQVVAVASTKKGAYKVEFVSFTIDNMLDGETLNETEAVAKISSGRMFETVQYAVNAAEKQDTVTLLKNIDTSDSVEINKLGLKIDLNGKTIKDNFVIKTSTILTDSTSTPGTIDLSNDTLNPAIEVEEGETLTVNNGINIKAYTYGILATGENTMVLIEEANITEEYSGEFQNDYKDYSAVKVTSGATLWIMKGNATGEAKVNLTSDRYAIYAENANEIKIINNQEKNADEEYMYELYGNVSSIYTKNTQVNQTQINIQKGRFTTFADVSRTTINLSGNIEFTTEGGIIGSTDVGKGVNGSAERTSTTTEYIPRLTINGTTKIIASNYGVFVGGSRYNIPSADINLHIGTDDNGNNTDGVQITASEDAAVVVSTQGTSNIVLGKPNPNYSGDNSKLPTEGASPIINGYNKYALGTGIECESGTANLDINCKAVIFGNANPIYNCSTDEDTNNNSNYTLVTEKIEGISPIKKAVYLKNN